MAILVFIIITFFALLAAASIFRSLWISIQQGHWLGKWQQHLRTWDLAGKTFWHNALGGCAVCTSHFAAHVLGLPYLAFILFQGFVHINFVWVFFIYLGYVYLSTTVNQYFITKLFK